MPRLKRISDQDRINSLRKIAYRGNRLKKLLESEVWIADLKPLLDAEKSLTEKAGRWSPSSKRFDTGAVALMSAYAGGWCDSLSAIEKRMEIAIRRGEYAARKTTEILKKRGGVIE